MATWNTDKPALANQISDDVPDIEECLQELHDVITAITNGTLGTTEPADFEVDTLVNRYVKVSDVKAQGVHGGTFTFGAWRTRDINTEDSDDANICSIAGNQITLEAGTYICSISCPACRVVNHKAQLYNITDAAQTLLGTAEFCVAGQNIVTRSFIVGQFTIAAQKVFEVQHWGAATQTSNGFGSYANFGGNEVYTVAEFWRIK